MVGSPNEGNLVYNQHTYILGINCCAYIYIHIYIYTYIYTYIYIYTYCNHGPKKERILWFPLRVLLHGHDDFSSNLNARQTDEGFPLIEIFGFHLTNMENPQNKWRFQTLGKSCISINGPSIPWLCNKSPDGIYTLYS